MGNSMKGRKMGQGPWSLSSLKKDRVYIRGNGIWERNTELVSFMMDRTIATIVVNSSITKNKAREF